MKVIKKPTLPIQSCYGCGAIVKVKLKELKTNGLSLLKTEWQCPVCKTYNNVDFKEEKRTDAI